MDRGAYGWVVDVSVLGSVNSARFSWFVMGWLEIVALRLAIIGIAVAGVKAAGPNILPRDLPLLTRIDCFRTYVLLSFYPLPGSLQQTLSQ